MDPAGKTLVDKHNSNVEEIRTSKGDNYNEYANCRVSRLWR